MVENMLGATADILQKVDQLDNNAAGYHAKRLLWTHVATLTPYHLRVWLHHIELHEPPHTHPLAQQPQGDVLPDSLLEHLRRHQILVILFLEY